ncbi:hypothetical protein BH11PSE11_BH11PSE11_13370 [soil metagenome]
MKIDSSTLNFSTSHSASSQQQVRENLRAWVGDKRPDFEGRESQINPAAAGPASLSAVGLAASKNALAPLPVGAAEAQALNQISEDVESDPGLALIKLMVEMLSGHKIKWISAGDFEVNAPPVESIAPPPESTAPSSKNQSQKAPARAGFGFEYDRHEERTETEQTAFRADGLVRTTDGKEISFTLDLLMSRSFNEQSDISIRAGDGVKKDPLVLNFGGTAAQLQSRRFSFDLDGDGEKEEVPLLSGNSGYLALDLNQNGRIDSGKELFGPKTGNGFTELAGYDSDGNGWIDEGDAVFKNLRIWSPATDGKASLQSLQQRGVGALFLGHQDTPFALKDGANNELGMVRASSVYLTEDGGVGTVQQIDLVV